MATNPTLLAIPLAENGTKNVIPETQVTAGDGLFSQSTGFPAETSLPLGAGGVAPSREDFNGMANLLGGVAFYAQKGWYFYYDNSQTYFKGCVVRDLVNDKLYECVQDISAGGGTPSLDNGTNWREFSTGAAGTIIAFLGAGSLFGFFDCDGSAVSRTTYSSLFAVIGTTYGVGDGSTTFNLPNVVGRYLQGASTPGTIKSAGLPNITGDIYAYSGTVTGGFRAATGAFATQNEYTKVYSEGDTSATSYQSVNFNASRSSYIYGNSTTVTPATLTVRYMIKY